MSRRTDFQEEYLGDGVYASFDGYHIILDLRAQADERHMCVIALEPAVMAALRAYELRMLRKEEP